MARWGAQSAPPNAPAGSAATRHLGVGVTGAPIRPADVADRAGQQADGCASTREAKLVLEWTLEQRDEDGRPRCDTGSVIYSAASESAASRNTDPDPSDCVRRGRRETERRGFHLARCRGILDDGV